MHYHGLQQEEG